MKQYELTYLTSATLPENEVKELQDKINSLISEGEGTLDEIRPAIKKELEYPVKKESVVFLNTVNFHMNPEKLDTLEKRIDEEKRIISRMFLAKTPGKLFEMRRRVRKAPTASEATETTAVEKPKKVEIKEIEKKLEEILGE